MKILASDFDNTLYVQNTTIFQKNIISIKEFIKKGNIFCIITGRNYTNIKQLLEKYDIPYNYLICQDGANIFDNKDSLLDTIKLEEDSINKAIDILDKNNFSYYLEDRYNQTTNKNYCVKITSLYNNIDNIEKTNKILQELQKIDNVYAYLSKIHINITHKLANKYASLLKLLKIESLNISNLYVIGDEVNDFEMIKNFNSAIMKEHSPILDELNKKEYNYLYEYIEELSNN